MLIQVSSFSVIIIFNHNKSQYETPTPGNREVFMMLALYHDKHSYSYAVLLR